MSTVLQTRRARAPKRRTAAKPSVSGWHLNVCRAGLGSDRAVAEVLDVSPSQISRWRRGQVPDADNSDRLAGLSLVVEMLERWLEREAVEGWIGGSNAHLQDRTPAFLIRRGQMADVIGAIEAEKAGVYA